MNRCGWKTPEPHGGLIVGQPQKRKVFSRADVEHWAEPVAVGDRLVMTTEVRFSCHDACPVCDDPECHGCEEVGGVVKLLFCPDCHDVFRLFEESRSCRCGKISGRYLDDVNAEVSPGAVSLAIGTGSLQVALAKRWAMGDNKLRHEYVEGCPLIAWVRPNQGLGNPHTVVRGDV